MVDGRAVGNLPNHIHKIHMGEFLAKKNYNYGGVLYNETLFPQDLRNCTKCHDGSATSTAQTAQGDNWKNAPSRRACGACHDGINFATGAGVTIEDALEGLTKTTRFNGLAHGGGAQSDDSTCAQCHTPDNIDKAHLPITPPNTKSALHVAGGNANTNAAWIASNTNRLPAGAIKVTYEIQSVSRNASKQPVMVFRMLQNGQRADLNNFATTRSNPATGAKEIWDNFMGSPSAYFVFSVPQDGISQPADFNANVSGYLRSIWNGTATGSGAGTLTGPDANGFYTVTLTGVQVPDNAVMLTGGLGFSYNVTSTLPLTQTNVDSECSLAFDPLRPRPNQCYPVSASPIGQANKIGGLIVIAPNVQKVADGYTGRRPIVEDARCNKCHQELGAFTRTPSTVASATTARRARGATLRIRPAVAGRRTRPATSIRSMRATNARYPSPGTPRPWANRSLTSSSRACSRTARAATFAARTTSVPQHRRARCRTGCIAPSPLASSPSTWETRFRPTAARAALPVRRRRRLTSARTRCHRTSWESGELRHRLQLQHGTHAVELVHHRRDPGDQSARRYAAGGSAHPGEFADRDGVLRVPRH